MGKKSNRKKATEGENCSIIWGKEYAPATNFRPTPLNTCGPERCKQLSPFSREEHFREKEEGIRILRD